MSFSLNRTYDLSEVGWDGCSITVKSLTYGEVEQIKADIASGDEKTVEAGLIDKLASNVIEGEGLDEKGNKVKITKDNFKELPLAVITHVAYKAAGGDISPNLNTP